MGRYELDQTNVGSDVTRMFELLVLLRRYDMTHDETFDPVYDLMGAWMIDEFPVFNEAFMDSGEQDDFDDAAQWLSEAEYGSDLWWYDASFSTNEKARMLPDEAQASVAHRLRNTIFCLMHHDGVWEKEEILAKIDECE